MQATTSWARALLITVSGTMLSFGVGTAYATATSGAWSSGSLNRCHLGSYSSNCSSGASVWSVNTDLTLGYNCSSLNFQTLGYNYGATSWAGLTYICNGSSESDCGSTYGDLVGTFQYGEARNNEYWLAGYTSAKRQNTCMHELGHVWGLWHDTSATSIMQSSVTSVITLNATNKSDVNAKY